MLAYKFLHRPLMLLISSILLVGFLVGIVLTIVCGSDQVLVPGSTGYTVTGEFAVQRTPSMQRSSIKAVEAENKDIILWGSGINNEDKNTGKLTFPPFQAPAILSFFVGGWANADGNELLVKRADTGEQFQLKAADTGDRWKKLHWLLPISWYGHPIQIIAVDGNQKSYGWIGISAPLQSSFLSLLKGQISAISFAPFYIFYLALFLTPGLLIGIFIIRRQNLHPAFTVILAVAISSLIGYVTFWVYFFNHFIGIIFSVLVLLLTVTGLVLLFTKKPFAKSIAKSLTSVDTVFPILIMLTVGLTYLSVLYLIDAGDLPASNAQVRFFAVFPPDNVLPQMFTERLYGGQDPRPLFGEWLSSDRPPLQAGITLVQRPIAFLSGSDVGLHYQLIGTIVQSAWIAALWAVCRNMRLSGWQIAIVLAFSTFSGFFLFNSVYVWPKLLAGALMVFAFALLMPTVYESRRPTTAEAGLAGGAAALGLLAHGGVIFTLPAIALILVRPRCFPGVRQILIGSLMFGLMLAPWTAYQKFYEPPGDRLLKWHLAGVIDVDSRSFPQAFKDAYQHLSFAQIANNKWENLKMLIDYPKADAKNEYTAREKDFLHLFRALGVLNIGWLIWLASPFLKYLNSQVDIKRVHLVLSVGVLSVVVWILAMFGSGTTSIHQGSYATMILLFIGLATLLTKLSRWMCYSLLAFQSVVFVTNWVITSSFSTSDRLIVAPNIFMLGLMVISTGGIIWMFNQLAKQRFEFENTPISHPLLTE